MLLCFNFLTETITWIRRVNYRGDNTIPCREHALVCGVFFLEIGYKKPWKMCPKCLALQVCCKVKTSSDDVFYGAGWGKAWQEQCSAQRWCWQQGGQPWPPELSSGHGLGCSGHTGGRTCLAGGSQPRGEWAAQQGGG